MVSGILQCKRIENSYAVAMVRVEEPLAIQDLIALKKRVLNASKPIVRSTDYECKLVDSNKNEVQISLRFHAGMSNDAQFTLIKIFIECLSPLIEVEVVDVSGMSKPSVH